MMGDENVRENNMLPPPAPRKIYVRKMISVSAKVRRKLNFDIADESPDEKRIKLGPACNFFISQSAASRTFQPISVENTESIINDSDTDTTPRTPMRVTAPLSAHTNLNELIKHETDSSDNTLKVDTLAFTTPDKCICKIPRGPSEFASKRPLRL